MHRNKLSIVIFAVVVFSFLLMLGCSPTVGPAGPAGPSGPAGPAGPAGQSGKQGPLPPGTETGMDVTLTLSKPANGTHFVAGEKWY